WVIYILGQYVYDSGPAMTKYFVGTFFWKNPMAAYLLLFMPFVFAFSLERSGWVKWATIFVSIAMLAGLVLTRSRAGWIAGLIAGLIFFLPSIIRVMDKKKLFTLLIVAVAGISLGLLFSPKGVITERVESFTEINTENLNKDRSSKERLAMLDAGLDVAEDYPIFGVGPRSWPAIRAAYLKKLPFLPRFPHNAYLRAAAELGIPGLILLCLALLMTFLPLWRKCFVEKPDLVFTGIVTGLSSLFIHMAVDFDAAFAGLLLPSALLIALAYRLHSDSKIEPTHLKSRIPIIVLASAMLVLLLLRITSEQLALSATASAENRDLTTAQKQTQLSARLDPFTWQPRFLSAKIFMVKSDFINAEKMLRSAIKRAPTVAELHSELAEVSLAKGDTTSAINSLQKAISLASRANPESYFTLASIYENKKDYESAEKTYIWAIDAMAPFSGVGYSAGTIGYRYRSSIAWEKLCLIWGSRGDSLIAEVADFNAKILQLPREKDKVAKQLGFDTPSPELVVIQAFEAIARSDTSTIRKLTAYPDGALPHFPEGITMTVNKILDVREDPIGGRAAVDIILKSTKSDGEEGFAKSSITLKIRNGRWVASFEGS
ncbi:O-antigen ligase family protein, partial [bacterium]|nr:O-antigen ligase family protein [bacterium]